MAHRHHTIDYVEITVRDLEQAKAFYVGAFGWTLKDYGPTYCGIQGATKEQGGITVGEPRPGGPLVVLFSDDLDASHEAVVAAGGTITKPPFSFPGGRRFHFHDPSGNELAVWSQD